MMSLENPHLLLLDEPTNHLDMQCIDALAVAIKKFSGGTVLVSHDFRLIEQVANEIWVCDGGVTPWKGDIKAYKVHLSKAMKKAAKARMSSCVGAAAGSSVKVRPPSPPPAEKPAEPTPVVVEEESPPAPAIVEAPTE